MGGVKSVSQVKPRLSEVTSLQATQGSMGPGSASTQRKKRQASLLPYAWGTCREDTRLDSRGLRTCLGGVNACRLTLCFASPQSSFFAKYVALGALFPCSARLKFGELSAQIPAPVLEPALKRSGPGADVVLVLTYSAAA